MMWNDWSPLFRFPAACVRSVLYPVPLVQHARQNTDIPENQVIFDSLI